ncbi:MAG: hypothetical protein Q9163_003472 [Psora crenata]
MPSNHTAVIGDAVSAVTGMGMTGAGRYDYIIHDVFTGGAEPIELFTMEFLTDLSNLLSIDGTIAINYAGDLLLPSAAAVVKTILAVFPACRLFREMAAPSNPVTEDLINMVMFCRKSSGPFEFRDPVDADYLGSRARKEHLFPQHEIDIAQISSSSSETITRESTRRFRASQIRNAQIHWHLMRTVISHTVWENW